VAASAFATSFGLGQGIAALIALLIGLCVTLVPSAIFERWVDQPAISASRRLRQRIVVGVGQKHPSLLPET
jgi:hypothetical protein